MSGRTRTPGSDPDATGSVSDADVTFAPSSPRTPAGLSSTSRLAPGSIIAGRYRLVALLGRGGMGEVYRAEDLTLDQPIALKFLPQGAAVDDAKLAQFHNELRIARQVSHTNVCRLYDLGDADGRRFLTMEYVDGEDLASLLRRIGRIPQDKAIELARQLCAGVAAAHERGVLHRDLKPANVMIDGDGNVRITDFGIATMGGDSDTTLSGTPQYMAPELLTGSAASIKSDIYALGLILFEMFTGRRTYDAKTLGDLKQLHDTSTVTTPSSIVRDLDPAIERVILRCLSKDPAQRPQSALTIAAAWEGPLPDRPEYRVRIEVAAYRGRPVSMLIVGPWSRPSRMQALTRSSAQTVIIGAATLVLVLVVIAAMLLARYNGRARRADLRGAWRLALFVMTGYAAVWVLAAHHVPDVNQEMSSFLRYFGSPLVAAALLWVTYVAVEPYVRRFWPDGILGWTRLLSGYVRDPRVGRDVLTGCVFAAVLGLLNIVYEILPPLVGRPPAIPRFQNGVDALSGISELAGKIFDHMVTGVFVAMFAVLSFVLVRLIFRRTPLAIVAWVVVLTLFQASQVLTSGTSLWIAAAFAACVIAALTIMVVRYGLLVTAVAFAVGNLLEDIPLTLSLSHWTATTSNLTLATVLAVTCFGFYAARAGQPLFGKLEV